MQTSLSARLFSSLRTRLVALALLLVLLPTIIIGLLAFVQGRDTLRQQVGGNLIEIAAATSDSIEQFLTDRIQDVRFMANSAELVGEHEATLDDKQHLLQDFLESYSIYRAIYFTNSSGIIEGATDFTAGNQSATDWYQVASQGELYISDTTYLTTTQALVLIIAAPIYDHNDGSLRGVLAASLDIDLLSNLVAEREIGENGEVLLINQARQIMADEEVDEIFEEFDVETIDAAIEQGGTGFALGREEEFDGEALFAYTPVEGIKSNWEIVAWLPVAELDAFSNELAGRVALIGLLAIGVAAALVFPLTSSIINPLERLTSSASQFSAGRYDVQLPDRLLNTGNEIGQLGRAFAEMSSTVNKRDAELRDLNRDLESRVEARTTELNVANKELQVALARVKEAARVKSEFLANISHELRTPLNAIIGFSDMMLAGMTGPMNDKQTHKLQRLRENGGRLLTLINDLLDLTRIEAGRMDIIHKPFNAHRLIERIGSQMDVLAQQKQLDFAVSVDPHMPEVLMGDEKRLEQVIVNLLSNAFKFTPQGSVALMVTVNPAKSQWHISVEDTGIGIPPHARDLIFEEFRQIDGSYTRSYKGTGLGLAITHNLVRMMDGKIELKSELEVGSTFTVVLPLILPERAPQPAPEGELIHA
jgi:signal transduction histidine kinase